MGVADQLGLAQVASPSFMEARMWWARACVEDRILDVVVDLADLPAWTRSASRLVTDAVLSRLAERAADETEAAVALSWLLIPGAARIADCHRDLSPDIDQLVAGQLWLEICTHRGHPERAVAYTILQRTKRAVLAEFGVGDGATRLDRAWANTTVIDRIGEQHVAVPDDEFDASDELRVIVGQMLGDGSLNATEAGILASAASHADWMEAPLRGRAGMTSPDALEVLTWLEPEGARTMRRTVGKLLDRVAMYAREHAVLQDVESLKAAHESEWTFTEMVMIEGRPGMQDRLRRFHEVLRLIGRCRAQHSTGRGDEMDRCPACGCGSGDCGPWDAWA